MLDLETLHLKNGAHASREKGVCLMEAVASMAGEPHSDAPACACPVIATFGRRWNDDLDDAGRQRLKRFVPLIVGSKSTYEVQQRRGWMAADWMVRVHTPAWLDLAGLTGQAAALRALPELTDPTTLADSRKALNRAKTDSAAARDAAMDAAMDAAWAAATKKLEPTKVALQASAEDLLERILAVKA